MDLSFNCLIMNENNFYLYNHMDKTNKNGVLGGSFEKKAFKIVE